MTEYSSEDRGVLFINDKRSNDKQPNLTGNIELSRSTLDYLNAVAVEQSPLKLSVAAWKKEGKNGSFFSLRLTEPYDPNSRITRTRPTAKDYAHETPLSDGEIPF